MTSHVESSRDPRHRRTAYGYNERQQPLQLPSEMKQVITLFLCSCIVHATCDSKEESYMNNHSFVKCKCSDPAGCECVLPYLCQNNKIISDGFGILTPRMVFEVETCPGEEVCCGVPNYEEEVTVEPEDYTQNLLDVYQKNSDRYYYMCSASLVTKKVALTAGNCVRPLHSSEEIFVGLSTDEAFFTSVERSVTHPANYISLLFLKNPLDNASPIRLPKMNENFDWKNCHFEGSLIQKIDVSDSNNNSYTLSDINEGPCRKMLSCSLLYDILSVDEEIVLLYAERDSEDDKQCTGSSGTPFICRNNTQAGLIFKNGYTCSVKTYVTIIILSPFVDWINEEIQRSTEPTTTVKPEPRLDHLLNFSSLVEVLFSGPDMTDMSYLYSGILIQSDVVLTQTAAVTDMNQYSRRFVKSYVCDDGIVEVNRYISNGKVSMLFLERPMNCSSHFTKKTVLKKSTKCYLFGRQRVYDPENYEDEMDYTTTDDILCFDERYPCYLKFEVNETDIKRSLGKVQKGLLKSYKYGNNQCIISGGSPISCTEESGSYSLNEVALVIYDGDCYTWNNTFKITRLNRYLSWINDNIKVNTSETGENENYGKDEIKQDFTTFPWMLSIYKDTPSTLKATEILQDTQESGKEKAENEVQFLCTATLIHPQIALTAAHCLCKSESNCESSAIYIRAGKWYQLPNEEQTKSYQERRLKKFAIHKKFNGKLLHGDIALLYWTKPFELGNDVKFLKIADKGNNFDNKACYGVGLENRNLEQRNLKKIHLPVVDVDTCHIRVISNSRLRLYSILPNHLDGVICAGGQRDMDTCQGDSGGPLICPAEGSDFYVQAGIVSAGLSCGLKGVPAFYTNISFYREWIDEEVSLINGDP